MIEAVFISDLHLHPNEPAIEKRFNDFILWAKESVKTIYILGDFLHVWPGDDALDEWSLSIAARLHGLVEQGISLYYMHGNRDFLLGTEFARRAGWHILADPTLVQLGTEQVLLAHGDRYCSYDKRHQHFRALTRNACFSWLFLKLPLNYRKKLVDKVRTISQSQQGRTMTMLDVSTFAIIKEMKRFKVNTMIHGHTHKPGLSTYPDQQATLKRYVLSDWDDFPQILCYDSTNGFIFISRFE
jgi:UDP-2,3-diacylglucosamine hydrolase